MKFRNKNKLNKSIYILTGHHKSVNNSRFKSFSTLKKIEYIAVIIAASALITQAGFSIMQYFQWKTETEARQEERIFRAWQIITSSSPGNGGLVQAVEFLAKNSVSLKGIDLSCKTHGGDWRTSQGDKLCAYGRPNLMNLNLSEENIGRQVDLTEANFNGADLRQSNFSGAILGNASFENSDLAGAIFNNTILHDASFHSMFGSYLPPDNRKTGADFRGANLGHTKFTNASLQYSKFDGELSLGIFDGAYIADVDFSEGALSHHKVPDDSSIFGSGFLDIIIGNYTYEKVFETSWIFMSDNLPKFPASDNLNPYLFLKLCDSIVVTFDPLVIHDPPKYDCRLRSDWSDKHLDMFGKKHKEISK